MFIIEEKILYPFPEDQEVKFTVLRPSEFQKLKAWSFLKDGDSPADSSLEMAIKMTPMIESLAKDCIKKIEGVRIGNKEPKNGSELVEIGIPSQLYAFLFMQLVNLTKMDEDDKKKL